MAENLKKAKHRSPHPTHPQAHKIQAEDSVLIKDHTAGPFQPTYKGDYRVVSLKGNQVDVMPSTGRKPITLFIFRMLNRFIPADSTIAKLPNYDNFVRKNQIEADP